MQPEKNTVVYMWHTCIFFPWIRVTWLCSVLFLVKDDDFSDEAEDLDDNKESHVTNTHADSHSHAHSHAHTHAHCPHIHTHCHNKHHRHYHTHGSYHDDEDEDVNERYPFDYCSLEREPAKRQKSSNQYIGYHGTG